ncbi:MAG: hypothetical protein ALAOOOJD_02420 [bacterium]|nr:hypothetical protein [bacterium]
MSFYFTQFDILLNDDSQIVANLFHRAVDLAQRI